MTDPTLLAALDAAIADARPGGAVPGLALAVTDRDGLVLTREAGHADPAAGRPVEPGTLFEIGSIGKSFTAAVILQLADEGRLSVDDPVVRHLPWFRVPRTGDRITIHHLLSHTAGITAGVDGTPEATFQVWRLRDLRPGSAPGRHFHYSNVGYKTLGLVIEAIEGASYGEVIRRRLLEPVGMRDSTPTITDAIRPRLAIGHEPAFSEHPWSTGDPIAPAPWLTTGTADGSVAATAADLAAWARFLMIDQSGVSERMRTVVHDEPGAEHRWGYGYALARLELGGRTWIGHGGGMVGYHLGDPVGAGERRRGRRPPVGDGREPAGPGTPGRPPGRGCTRRQGPSRRRTRCLA